MPPLTPPSVLRHQTLGIIGLGTMAGCVLNGLLSPTSPTMEGIEPQHVWAVCSHEASCIKKAESWGIRCWLPNAYGHELRTTTVLLLAVKPAQAPQALAQLKALLAEYPPSAPILLVSLVAGLSLDRLQSALGDVSLPLARAMPNVAATVGESVTSIHTNALVSPAQKELLASLFRSIGSVYELEESKVHAITALAGGPAFVSVMADGLAQGLLANGIPLTEARAMVAQLLVGTGKLLQAPEQSPERLIQQVTTPAGTTIEGLRILEQHALRSTFIEAICASADKSKRL